MTKRFATALAVLALALPLAAQAADSYDVDAAHSSVSFSIRHFVSEVEGRFKDFSGSLAYDAANPAASSVTFTIQAKSIDTANEKRDGHLRSPDFFDADKFATLSFESTKVVAKGKDLEVTGKFTMHGVTKEITIPVKVGGVMATPMGTKAGFKTVFTINRKDFGVSWNKVLDAGSAILGDEVEVTVNIEANKK